MLVIILLNLNNIIKYKLGFKFKLEKLFLNKSIKKL